MKQKYRVRQGGLMRCCLLTLDDAMVAATEPPKQGDTLSCTYCKPETPNMVFLNGAWMSAPAAERENDAPRP